MFDFIFGNEGEVTNLPDNIPTAAFVIVESEKGFMLLYNKYRKIWEITGGYIEQNELPMDAAIRECKEESNQDISDLSFVGLAKYANMNAAVYYAFLEVEKPFSENDEIKELRWWKLGEELSDPCKDSVEFIKLYSAMEERD